jgi:RNA polymerase sigma-70 factor, ECF subfamily
VPHIPLDLIELPGAGRIEETTEGLLRLNDALDQLMTVSERQGRLVEYRFFGGLSYEDIAGILEISARTAKRDWTRARAWLYTYMKTAVT